MVAAALVPAAGAAADADALQQQNAEVERLKRSLEQAEKELNQLKEDNARLRQQQEKPAGQQRDQDQKRSEKELKQLRDENERLRQARERAAQTPAAPARELKPVRPIAGLPPLTPETVVEAEELIGHFAAEPAAAAARYGRQTFHLKGEVERFNPARFTRGFTIVLASPDRAYSVVCQFNYVGRYQTVFMTRNGRTLTARYEDGREVTLFEAGQTVVIAGRCAAADKHGEIEFSRCELPR
jgi:hypothetical protein